MVDANKYQVDSGKVMIWGEKNRKKINRLNTYCLLYFCQSVSDVCSISFILMIMGILRFIL